MRKLDILMVAFLSFAAIANAISSLGQLVRGDSMFLFVCHVALMLVMIVLLRSTALRIAATIAFDRNVRVGDFLVDETEDPRFMWEVLDKNFEKLTVRIMWRDPEMRKLVRPSKPSSYDLVWAATEFKRLPRAGEVLA